MSISFPSADFAPTLSGYTGQGAFRFWCQKVLPIVYDDSLSYYELLNKVVNYLNNVISDVSALEDNVGELNDSYVELQNYVNEHMEEIEGFVNELEQYMNDYFDNLDVQTEINNKLNNMVSDGTFTALIEPVISLIIPDIITQWLEDNIGTTVPAIDATLSVSGAGADAKATGDLFPLAYDPTRTYTVGEYCFYNGKMYRCLYDNVSGVTFDASKWARVNLGDVIRIFGWRGTLPSSCDSYNISNGVYYVYGPSEPQNLNIGLNGFLVQFGGNDAKAQLFCGYGGVLLIRYQNTLGVWTDFNKLESEERTNQIENVVSFNAWSATASGEVFLINNLANKKYWLLVKNIYGNQSNLYPKLYLFNTDESSTEIVGDNKRIFNGKILYSFEIDDNVDYIRLYMNKASSATECGCEWCLFTDENALCDTILKSEIFANGDTLYRGSYSRTSNGEVTKIYGLTVGNVYDLYVWDIVGSQSVVYPRAYIFLTDSTYIQLDGEYVYDFGGMLHYRFEIPENFNYVRIFVNKAGTAESCSGEYCLIKYAGGPLEFIQGQIKQVKASALTKTTSTNVKTCNIFKKVVCCGDSYTSGYSVDKNNVEHVYNEDYAWPHYMETLTGNTWINCGVHGANSLTWQAVTGGLEKARTAGLCQAYVLGLGLNDEAQGTSRYVPVGDVSDIGTNAQTYYGGISKIIRELASISPNAFIFVNTNPNIAYNTPNRDATEYNTALRTIVAAYEDDYNVHLIDLAGEYIEYYQNASLLNDVVSSHFTALGYEQFAEIYAYILSDYINKNIDTFTDVAFIPIA